MTSTLIVGCGDLGNQIACLLHTQKHQIFGIRRNINNLAAFITPIAANIANTKEIPQLPKTDHLIFCPAPTKRQDYKQIYLHGLQNVLKALKGAPKKIWIVSSTSVFAEQNGSLIDEHSKKSNSENARVLLAMEQVAHQFSDTTVIRLSGLYGFFRWSILRKISENTLSIGNNHWANRIHLHDAARAVVHLMQLKKTEPLYLISDNTPFQMKELYQNVCPILQTPMLTNEKDNVSGKRINAQKLMDTGFTPIYPSAIETYKMLAEYYLQFSKMTDFQQQVLTTTFDIPFGKVTSYLGIAKRTQSPKASRAVGQIMANNPLASQLPCHRVVAHNRQLHGYSSSTNNKNLKTKLLNLLAEDIQLTPHPTDLYKYKIAPNYFW